MHRIMRYLKTFGYFIFLHFLLPLRKNLHLPFSRKMSASAVDEGSLEEAAGVEAGSPTPKGWEVAAEAIKLALNNRVEDAQDLLDQSKASCVHRQAGYCYLAFIVSTYFYLLT